MGSWKRQGGKESRHEIVRGREFQEPLKDTVYLGSRMWGGGREPLLLPCVGSGLAGRSGQDVATSSTFPVSSWGAGRQSGSGFLGSC